MAFAWSNWNDGIETWRFNLPTDSRGSDEPSRVVHTVFDRTLLRVGIFLMARTSAYLHCSGMVLTWQQLLTLMRCTNATYQSL